MCQRILQAMTQTLEIPLNVNYIYEYEFTLNQDIRGVNGSLFGGVTGSPVQNWVEKCCLIYLCLSLQGMKK